MASGRIDFDFLKDRIKDFNQYFYICGPKNFEQDITKSLKLLGAKKDVFKQDISFRF